MRRHCDSGSARIRTRIDASSTFGRRPALTGIQIPGFQLPKLDLDLQLKPDLQALHDFNAAAQVAAEQAGQAMSRIAEIVRFWVWVFYVAVAMVLLWLLLAVVGYGARMANRIGTGWQMLCGRRAEGALALL